MNPFSNPAPRILPSILSADFSKLGSEIAEVVAAGCDVIHVDVMDGHLVPNISIGVPVVKSVRKCTPAFLDVHLMISEPLRYAEAFCKAGAQNLTFHVEAVDDARKAALEIKKLGCNVGITLKPGTPVESVFPALDVVDLVLVMSVEPGFGGQSFMPAMLDKCRVIKPKLKPHQKLEIDGGIHLDTIAKARAAGVDWFVIGSAIFDTPNRAETIKALGAKLLT